MFGQKLLNLPLIISFLTVSWWIWLFVDAGMTSTSGTSRGRWEPTRGRGWKGASSGPLTSSTSVAATAAENVLAMSEIQRHPQQRQFSGDYCWGNGDAASPTLFVNSLNWNLFPGVVEYIRYHIHDLVLLYFFLRDCFFLMTNFFWMTFWGIVVWLLFHSEVFAAPENVASYVGPVCNFVATFNPTKL